MKAALEPAAAQKGRPSKAQMPAPSSSPWAHTGISANDVAVVEGSQRRPEEIPPPPPVERKPLRKWTIVSIGSIATLVTLAGMGTWKSPGAQAIDVAVVETGVWASNPAMGLVGKINVDARQTELAVKAQLGEGSTVDVLQDGQSVVVYDRTANSLTPLDARTGQLLVKQRVQVGAPFSGTNSQVYPSTVVDMRGGTLATVDGRSGDVRMMHFDRDEPLKSLKRVGAEGEVYAKVGPGAAVAVGVDGSVYAASAQTGRVNILRKDGNSFLARQEARVPTTRQIQLTVVGTKWVVFDPIARKLYVDQNPKPVDVPSGSSDPDGEPMYAALQVPGPAAGVVALQSLVSAQTAPIEENLSSRELAVGDVPGRDQQTNAQLVEVSRPIMLNGCLHAAWASRTSVAYGRHCASSKTQRGNVVALTGSEKDGYKRGVAWRTNGPYYLLNDLDTGDVYDPKLTSNLRVDSWDSSVLPFDLPAD